MSTETARRRPRSMARFNFAFATTTLVLALLVVGFGAWSALAVRLQTPASSDGVSSVAVLQRHADADDEIVLRDLTNGADHTVFSAPTIQEFALGTSMLAVVTLDASDAPTLSTIDLSDAAVTPIALPGAGTVTQLRVSSTDDFGFVFTSAGIAAGEHSTDTDLESALFVTASSATGSSGAAAPAPTLSAQPVADADGTPLLVADWAFVPGSGSFVVQSYDQQVYLVDAAQAGAAPPALLGTFFQLLGFVPGTVQLVVTDSIEGSSIDLATGKLTTLNLPASDLDDTAIPGQILLTDGLDSYVQEFSQDTTSGAQVDTVLYTTGDGSRQLYQTSGDDRVANMCASRDGSRLAITVAAMRQGTDGVANLALYNEASTVIVDIASGSRLATIDGQIPSWCRN